MQEQLPEDAAVERTGTYSPRVRKTCAGSLMHGLVTLVFERLKLRESSNDSE